MSLLALSVHAQSPDPHKLGLFVASADGLREVAAYAEPRVMGLSLGYRFDADDLRSTYRGVKHVFINMPGIDVMSTKLCWQRAMPGDGLIPTSKLFIVPSKLGRVSGDLYRLDAPGFEHTTDGYYFVRIRMPAGSGDRLYVIPLRAAPPVASADDRDAAIQTLARIRTLDAVWTCLMTAADLNSGYDFEDDQHPARRVIPVQRLRAAGHDRGCWNVQAKDIPTEDGWGRPFQLSVWGGSRLEERSRGFEIRSAGRDGVFEHTAPAKDPRSSALDADIVWIRTGTYAGEGSFTQAPNGVPLPVCPSNGDCFEPRMGR